MTDDLDRELDLHRETQDALTELRAAVELLHNVAFNLSEVGMNRPATQIQNAAVRISECQKTISQNRSETIQIRARRATENSANLLNAVLAGARVQKEAS